MGQNNNIPTVAASASSLVYPNGQVVTAISGGDDDWTLQMLDSNGNLWLEITGNGGGGNMALGIPEGEKVVIQSDLSLRSLIKDQLGATFFDQNHFFYDSGGNQILAAQQANIVPVLPPGESTTADMITAINSILDLLAAHGLMAGA